jgi:predicted kinase
MPTHGEKQLLVIRGNSGSGKSTIARRLRLRAGRGWALVEQDYLRRILLRERDTGPGLAPALIEHNVRFLLNNGYHVILEGILFTGRYGEMLRGLAADHLGPAHFFYLNVSFAETVRRHATRPQALEFTSGQMCEWYAELDVLDGIDETVIAETSSEDETLNLIAQAVGLGDPTA